jgi:hypothetical protein
MLDMRDAILQADQVINDGAHSRELWRVFAGRGMGWYAGAVDGGDASPTESFRVRPRSDAATGVISGTLTDDQTGEPLSGIRVVVAGHDGRYSATTRADGGFDIRGVLPGTYRKVSTGGRGYAGFTPPGHRAIRPGERRDRFAAARLGRIVGRGGRRRLHWSRLLGLRLRPGCRRGPPAGQRLEQRHGC